MVRCVVCKVIPDYPLHRFPNPNKYPQRFRLWVSALGKKLAKESDTDIYRTKRICGKHFEEKCCNNNSRLNHSSLPTLYLESKVEDINCNTEDSESIADKEISSAVSQDKGNQDCNQLLDDAVEVDAEHIPELDFALNGDSLSDDGNTHVDTSMEQTNSSDKPMNTCEDVPASKQYMTTLTYITVPGKEIATQISRALIEHDLAATVEVLSEVKSVYKSQGKVREDSKIILMVKTRSSRVSDLCEFAAERFPLAGYQIVSVPIENGNPHYLKWIADTVPSH